MTAVTPPPSSPAPPPVARYDQFLGAFTREEGEYRLRT